MQGGRCSTGTRRCGGGKTLCIQPRGELHKLPEKPPEFLKSRLLTVRGRLRVIYEMIAGGTDNPDETLAQFGTRRLGSEAFRPPD